MRRLHRRRPGQLSGMHDVGIKFVFCAGAASSQTAASLGTTSAYIAYNKGSLRCLPCTAALP